MAKVGNKGKNVKKEETKEESKPVLKSVKFRLELMERVETLKESVSELKMTPDYETCYRILGEAHYITNSARKLENALKMERGEVLEVE